MTKLQLALDLIDLDAAVALVDSVGEDIDIIEAGTPFLLRYGMAGAAALKARFPTVELLCDAKILDAGAEETAILVDAGADWVTVMARTDEATIRACVDAAHRAGARVMADLLGVADMPGVARRLCQLGVDCVAVHVGVDRQARGETPLKGLAALARARLKCMAAVAGGIDPDSAPDYLAYNPDILIVGGGILRSPDPALAAKRIRALIEQIDVER